MEREQSLIQVCDQLGLEVRHQDRPDLLGALEEEINRLLVHDFDRLIAILYRVDVSEHKLKDLLKKQSGEDAAKLIASLLIERQQQKIRSRGEFNSSDDQINEDERW
ncbi:hypothetical protein LZZ85_26775 [Terrimonas sp. NA20]|uniref:Uncharacterized protein n=1 Tax=Terrimonas ginsenosidimutans TaxID=2908004 RepID=A0ABS9L016_9BACT|nr:hypothetical protein [Terrimonas ginsenosidimutans]MCG2617935.1 hypothetical protein [Terrimonas ginsenosidimutans]